LPPLLRSVLDLEVFDAIEKRRSVRAYDSRPVPDDILMKILETGRIAPSASNIQPWHFIVVRDPEKRKALSDGRWAKFLTESPVVIVGCGNKDESPEWHVIDVTIAMQQMVIAATAEGLGTCWIGSFYEDRVRKALNVPEELRIVAMLALGYSREKLDLTAKPVRTRNRKKMEDILSYESFGASKN
jgi:nitroreductase